uniref:Acyltransferase PGAP2 n=1 Tax=Neogobius melanostomus TaxID=47308 RepID=A0A8C6U314_9GOBI
MQRGPTGRCCYGSPSGRVLLERCACRCWGCSPVSSSLRCTTLMMPQEHTLLLAHKPQCVLQVSNYLPSISASISLSPECHIWRACIGLHWAPRVLVLYSYSKLYRCRFGARSVERTLSVFCLLFAVCENMGLLLLTSVSSTEAYAVHKAGFLLFICSSLIYMLITCRLWSAITRQYFSPEDAKSHRWKKRLLLVCYFFCGFAAFFYWKHNMYCQSGAYTMFALFEYLLVFSIMAFHLTAIWDFRSREIVVVSLYEDRHF